jgi:putative salt-induced outer membrane protein YdiY
VKHILCSSIIIGCLSLQATAETIKFKNGEQLTGEWKQVQGANLVFQSESLGEVTIPLDKLQSFAPSKPAALVTNSGEVFRGQLSLLASGEWELRRGENRQTFMAASVSGIYPEESYKPPEVKNQPWQSWKGAANLGYGLQRGDQNAGSLTVGVNATRKLPDLPGHLEHWRTNYLLNMLFATTQANGVRVTSNNLTTNLRQDYLITTNDFFFISGQLDHVDAQSLQLRQTYGGGYGRDVLRRKRLSLSLLGGPTYVHEQFKAAPIRSSVELLLGEKFDADLTKGVHFENVLNFYPNLSNTGEYRFDTTSTLSIRLSNRLSANTALTDLYLSNPIPGGKSNNLSLTTGIAYNF